MQLSWVGTGDRRARRHAAGRAAEPARTPSGKAPSGAPPLLEEDARDAQAFVDRWTPRVEAMTNARHARCCASILGETLEQKRFFEQALAGRPICSAGVPITSGRAWVGAADPVDLTVDRVSIGVIDCPRLVAAIALGSNLGDRARPSRLRAFAASPILANVEFLDGVDTARSACRMHRGYLNAAAVGRTRLPARECSSRCCASSRRADASAVRATPRARSTSTLFCWATR